MFYHRGIALMIMMLVVAIPGGGIASSLNLEMIKSIISYCDEEIFSELKMIYDQVGSRWEVHQGSRTIILMLSVSRGRSGQKSETLRGVLYGKNHKDKEWVWFGRAPMTSFPRTAEEIQQHILEVESFFPIVVMSWEGGARAIIPIRYLCGHFLRDQLFFDF